MDGWMMTMDGTEDKGEDRQEGQDRGDPGTKKERSAGEVRRGQRSGNQDFANILSDPSRSRRVLVPGGARVPGSQLVCVSPTCGLSPAQVHRHLPPDEGSGGVHGGAGQAHPGRAVELHLPLLHPLVFPGGHSGEDS